MDLDNNALRAGAPADVRADRRPLRILTGFTLPLASVIILQLVGRQAIVAGLSWHGQAHGQDVAFDIAAFVVAIALSFLACAPIEGLGMLALAHGDDPATRRRISAFAGLLTLLSTLALALLAFSSAGFWFISNVQGLDDELARRVQQALAPMVLWPLILATMAMASGWLKRGGHGFPLAVANVIGLATTVGLVVSLPAVGMDPLEAGMLAYLTGQGLRAGLLLLLAARGREPDSPNAAPAPPPGWRELTGFYAPLAWNSTMMLASRPLIQWFLARQDNPEIVLAGFGVAFGISQIFYGWLNDLRSHATAFREQPQVLAKLPDFAIGLCALMTGLMAALFWTPLGRLLVARLMGLQGEILDEACAGLAVMAFCPMVVTLRAYYQGLAVLHRQTNSYFTSAIVRIVGIAAVLALLPGLGLNGSVLGTCGLIGGFLTEGLALAWSLHGAVPSLRLRAAGQYGQ
ncbi:MAG: hypothetical protein M5U26_21385 [Planctomycetota bacterium]|nr:hypothetical protein [Planctomycetota bacterium]